MNHVNIPLDLALRTVLLLGNSPLPPLPRGRMASPHTFAWSFSDTTTTYALFPLPPGTAGLLMHWQPDLELSDGKVAWAVQGAVDVSYLREPSGWPKLVTLIEAREIRVPIAPGSRFVGIARLGMDGEDTMVHDALLTDLAAVTP